MFSPTRFAALSVAVLAGLASAASAGTPFLLKDINPGPETSFADTFVPFNGQLYFRATNGADGIELWRTDGTPDGTQQVLDLRPGPSNSFPLNLTAVNGALYFNAYNTNPATGSKVFRSDGTAAGTQELADTYPGLPADFFGPPLPGDFTALNSTTILFSATDPTGGNELWRTDGTPGGTARVKDIHPGEQWSIPTGITTLNGIVYFTADDSFIDNGDGTATFDRELWRSDGTPNGTFRVKDINPGPQPSRPFRYTEVGGRLLFAATDDVHSTELWTTDGTEAGTQLLLDLNPSGPASPDRFTKVNNHVYFIADDGTHGLELFRTDGTAPGTQLIKDVNPTGDAFPDSIAGSGNKVFFNADDGMHGNELWVTDGSEGGTHLVKDINVGDTRSSPMFLTPFGDGLLFFVAIVPDDEHFTVQSQLWMTDGTELGTQLLFQSPGNDFGYSITNLTVLGDKLLFVAPTEVDADGIAMNFELHAIQVPEPSAMGLLGAAAMTMMRRRRSSRFG